MCGDHACFFSTRAQVEQREVGCAEIRSLASMFAFGSKLQRAGLTTGEAGFTAENVADLDLTSFSNSIWSRALATATSNDTASCSPQARHSTVSVPVHRSSPNPKQCGCAVSPIYQKHTLLAPVTERYFPPSSARAAAGSTSMLGSILAILCWVFMSRNTVTSLTSEAPSAIAMS